MSAPYRITRPSAAMRAAGAGDQQQFKSYLDRLMKMIPGEVVGLYLVGSGLIPASEKIALAIWALICLGGVIAIKAFGSADPVNQKPPDWVLVILSSVSFVIWVYTMGGPFAAYNLAVPYIGSLLVLAWTFFVPIFYKGPSE